MLNAGKTARAPVQCLSSRLPDAYSTDREVTSQFTDRLNDSVLNSLGAARGCQALNTSNNLATFIYDTSGNLRAANIYANAKQ